MTSHPDFGFNTTATEVAAAFGAEIKGKTVMIVGVSPNSLGEYLVLSTASQSPAHLIIASRTLSKIQEVTSHIHGTSPKISTITVDLGSQSSIRKAASEILSVTEKIDVLINNAAVNAGTHTFTEDGIEMQFGVNHIGLFLLTNLLKSVLVANGKSRVVNFSSAGHTLSPIRFSDPSMKLLNREVPESERPRPGLPVSIVDPEKSYSAFVAYGQSKTANILFSLGINERWGGKCVSYSVHPGSIWTNLPRGLDEKGKEMIRNTAKDWKTVDQGAATAMVAAFDPKLDVPPSEKEIYLSDCQFKDAEAWATNKESAEKLWKMSEDMVGETFPQSKL